jgi:predicted nucleic acid-binding protein
LILIDTSVWVEHLRDGNAALAQLLDDAAVLAHPWVTGEIALGSLRQRDEIIALLSALPRTAVATADEVLLFIERERLFGIGYVDAGLLAAVRLTPDATLWTTDKRLSAAAAKLRLGYDPHGR